MGSPLGPVLADILARGHTYLTIILRGRAGYEMIDNQRGA